jgi:AcrR family transcriptional regulator
MRRLTKPNAVPHLAKQRARNDVDKQLRRRAILDAARAVFAQHSYAGFSMTDVAARTGLAKGTLYLYFRTKEELLLELLRDLHCRWFEVLDGFLEAEDDISPALMAEIYVDTLGRHEPLARLLTVCQTMLEHNVDAEAIRAFKRAVNDRLAVTAALLERRLRLKAGEGRRVFLHAYALVVGLKQCSDPAPAVAAIMDEPEFRELRRDFRKELRSALVTYFTGLEAAR